MQASHRLVARADQAPTSSAPITFRSSAKKYANETPKQQADHHEVAKKYARKRKHSAKTYRRICELEVVFADHYGAVLPDDDAGLDDVLVMAHHLAHLDEPGRRIAAWVRDWAPWHSDDRTAELIEVVLRKPLKWSADKLADRIGLDDATRTRLGITTIGAIDCKKAKRAALRRNRKNVARQARRLEAGAKPHAASVEQMKPWITLGISRRTYYRRRANGTDGTQFAYSMHAVHNGGHRTVSPVGEREVSDLPDRRAADPTIGSALGRAGPVPDETVSVVERVLALDRGSPSMESFYYRAREKNN